MEVVARIAFAHDLIQFSHTVQHPAFKLWHLRGFGPVGIGKVRQRAQHIAHGVAQTAVAVGGAFQDFRPDPLVRGIIGLRHPQTQDIRAILLHDLFGNDGVADGFGHLHALLIQREPMRHDVTIRRAARGAHGLQQRRMEPAPVLVRAFHIDIRDTVFRAILAVAQNEGVGRTGIEPHVQNVEHLGIVVGVHDAAKEPLFRAIFVPDIRTVSLERLDNALVDLWVTQQEVFIRWQRAILGKAGQRHTPGPLTRQHPVGACFHHRVQTVAALFGHPVDVVDLGQGAFTDGLAECVLPVTNGPVDRGKPLRRVAVDDRSLGAPGMRIAVLDLAARQQPADLDQLVDNGRVGVAFLAVGFEDLLAAKERQIGAERPVFDHVIGDHLIQHPQTAVKFIFLKTMRRRTMDKARAFGVGHEISGAEVAQIFPFAIAAFGPRQRVLQLDLCQLVLRHIPQTAHHGVIQTRTPEHIHRHAVRQQIAITDGDPGFLGAAGDFVQTVRDILAIDDGLVGRHGPGRRGPDHDVSAVKAGVIRANNLELHPDRKAFLVVVFDLGLGQRSLFNRRPHHGFGALIERAVHQELHEFFGDHTFRVEIHRQIGIGPVAGDAQTFEFVTLHVYPAGGELAAFSAKIVDRHIVLVAALLAVLFLDLPFDGQAVAIPTGDIARVKAHHLVRPHDHILDRLVQRVADMQVAIRIGGAVVQREGLAPLLFAQAVIDADLFPPLQPFGFAFGQARAHREIGFWQVQRGFIVKRFGGVGAHGGRPLATVFRNGECSDAARKTQAPLPGVSSIRAPGK